MQDQCFYQCPFFDGMGNEMEQIIFVMSHFKDGERSIVEFFEFGFNDVEQYSERYFSNLPKYAKFQLKCL